MTYLHCTSINSWEGRLRRHRPFVEAFVEAFVEGRIVVAVAFGSHNFEEHIEEVVGTP